jgi:hypothetical protein
MPDCFDCLQYLQECKCCRRCDCGIKFADYCVSQNTMQVIKTTVNMLLLVFSIAVSSMLTITVPHSCDPAKSFNNICGVSDWITDGSIFKWIAVTINGFLFVSFSFIFIYEFKREYWMIKYLDYDPNLSDNNLQINRQNPAYKAIFEELDGYNDVWKSMYDYVSILYVTNFIISSVYVLRLYYNY